MKSRFSVSKVHTSSLKRMSQVLGLPESESGPVSVLVLWDWM